MRARLLAVGWCLAALTGCSYLGYYKHEAAERAPPEEAAKVEFPEALEGGVRLTGPMMAALKVAMADYRPPWVRPEDQKQPEDKCLADWSYIQTSVVQAGEDLFYVLFTPDLRACGPGFIVPDAGALYAIDGKGRILAREQ
jgi:hypothetical protein